MINCKKGQEMNKESIGKAETIFRAIFPSGKKGYETWELVVMILAIALLLFVIAWFVLLNQDLGELFGKVGEWF